MTVPEALRAAMDAGGYRAEDIACKTGISSATVYSILKGRSPRRLVLNALKQIPEFAERYDDKAVA